VKLWMGSAVNPGTSLSCSRCSTTVASTCSTNHGPQVWHARQSMACPAPAAWSLNSRGIARHRSPCAKRFMAFLHSKVVAEGSDQHFTSRCLKQPTIAYTCCHGVNLGKQHACHRQPPDHA
jgi:hypothetical protein